jgi:hypothetical protein
LLPAHEVFAKRCLAGAWCGDAAQAASRSKEQTFEEQKR